MLVWKLKNYLGVGIDVECCNLIDGVERFDCNFIIYIVDFVG